MIYNQIYINAPSASDWNPTSKQPIELWSLLNFPVPDIFNSSDNLDTSFNKPFENVGVGNSDLMGEEEMVIINRFHQVIFSIFQNAVILTSTI